MTPRRLYQLAYYAALEIWANKKQYLDDHENELAAEWERKAWAELNEIRDKLLELEQE